MEIKSRIYFCSLHHKQAAEEVAVRDDVLVRDPKDFSFKCDVIGCKVVALWRVHLAIRIDKRNVMEK